MDDYITRDEVLAHFGVKGMRWGVRKKDELAGDKVGLSSDKDEKSLPQGFTESDYKKSALNQKPKTGSEAIAALKANQEKFLNKFEPSEAPGSLKKGLSPEQKKWLIVAGVGAVTVGGILAYKHYAKANVSDLPDLTSVFKSNGINPRELESFRGSTLHLKDFQRAVDYSTAKTWNTNTYIRPESFLREEFSVPAGHLFTRLSRGPEDSFNAITYCTSNADDFNRYIASFRQELSLTGKNLHKITFKSTDTIRVPSLTQTLDALREAMHEEFKRLDVLDTLDSSAVVDQYQKLSGGGWDTPTAQRFIGILKSRGYGAIVDEMDAGVIGETPLVLFSQAVGKKASSILSNTDIKLAEENLVELTNRKIL